MQAPNSFLHSRTGAITRVLLNIVLALPSGAGSLPSEIINHSLTTLALHSSSPEAFAVVIEQLLAVGNVLMAKEPEWENIVVVMRAIETVVGVKKGGRVAGTCGTL